jgi:hypothetical protein
VVGDAAVGGLGRLVKHHVQQVKAVTQGRASQARAGRVQSRGQTSYSQIQATRTSSQGASRSLAMLTKHTVCKQPRQPHHPELISHDLRYLILRATQTQAVWVRSPRQDGGGQGHVVLEGLGLVVPPANGVGSGQDGRARVERGLPGA